MYGKLQHIPLVYFISLPAKVVPCPMYPDKVRPLRGLAERKLILARWLRYFLSPNLAGTARDSQAGEK